MRQGQPYRPQEQQEPVKYGDVFNVSGQLAAKPIAPEDANMMQAAETRVLGQTQKGGPAAVMRAVATHNECGGFVRHREATDIAGDQGVTIAQTDVPGARVTTDSSVVGKYIEPRPIEVKAAVDPRAQDAITIGEALKATVQTAGSKAVDQSDAAAIQAAEVRASGSNIVLPGGLAPTAQSAASHTATADRHEDKIKLTEILSGEGAKLPAEKAVTSQDAEGLVSAELWNNPNVATYPVGVAASMAAAARLNEKTDV